MDKKLRIAVVGVGKMGIMHASILNTLQNTELVAFCDKSPFINKFCNKMLNHKIDIVDDTSELYDLNLDVVYITTPIPSHYMLAKQLIENTKAHLFLEKTLTNSYSNSKELSDLAKQSGIQNMVGYMKRFSVTFQKAKQLLDQNTIGTINSFEAHAFSSDFYGVEQGSKMSASRGGVINDLGSHIIDIALWYFDELSVQPINKQDAIDIQNKIKFSVINGDVTGTFNLSWCEEGFHVPDFGISLKGKKGTIFVDDDIVTLVDSSGQKTRWCRHDLNDNVRFLLGAPEYCRENEYFINSILNKTEPISDFTSAAKVDNLIDQVSEVMRIE